MRLLKQNFFLLLTVLLVTSCTKPESSGLTIKTLNVTDDLGYVITLNATVVGSSSGGFVYSTSPNPTTGESEQAVAGSFVDTMTTTAAVDPNTTYYIRAYAWENNFDVVYGNEITYETGFAIGQPYQGGHIGYLFEEGDPGYIAGEQHGLIFSETLGTDVEWGCEGVSIPDATGMGVGTGQANTDAILAACGDAGIAARLCADYENDGYTDWYLPSHDELRAIDNNYERVSSVVTKAYCFSSSQSTANEAWAVYIWNPPVVEGPSAYSKSYGQKVMAVRNF